MDHIDRRDRKKVVRYLLPQSNPIVDLSTTSNSDHKFVHTDDDEEYDLTNRT